jgi:surfactin synthase thioesterase subunit
MGGGQSQVISLVQFAICILQLPICNGKKHVHKTLSNHNIKTLIQHLSLSISHSPLKFRLAFFGDSGYHAFKMARGFVKNQSAAWAGIFRRL